MKANLIFILAVGVLIKLHQCQQVASIPPPPKEGPAAKAKLGPEAKAGPAAKAKLGPEAKAGPAAKAKLGPEAMAGPDAKVIGNDVAIGAGKENTVHNLRGHSPHHHANGLFTRKKSILQTHSMHLKLIILKSMRAMLDRLEDSEEKEEETL